MNELNWGVFLCFWGGGATKETLNINNFFFLLQELRAAASSIESKHEKEIVSLLDSYKSLYPKWVFELRYGSIIGGWEF